MEPRLAALLGLEPAPQGSTEELAGAWRTLFERIADRGTTVLVFEDLHWADPGCSTSSRPSSAGPAPARSSSSCSRARSSSTTGRRGVRRCATTCASTSRRSTPTRWRCCWSGLAPGIPQDAIATIAKRAAGIPLYAVETVRMLLDSGRLVEHGGRYRLTGELGDLAVPDSLTALLSARLDALEPDVRDLVGHAAVLGISFDAADLAAVAGRPEAEVRAALDRLVRRELFVLDEDPRSPERGQHRFLQGVLREVAYGRLSRRERQLRHLGAAELLGANAADELAGRGRDPLPRGRQAGRGRGPGGVAVARPRGPRRGRGPIPGHRGARERGAPARGRHRARRGRGRAAAPARGARRWSCRATESVAEVARGGASSCSRPAVNAGTSGLQARAAFWAAGPLLAAGHPAEAVRRLSEMREALGPFVTEHPDGVPAARRARSMPAHGRGRRRGPADHRRRRWSSPSDSA